MKWDVTPIWWLPVASVSGAMFINALGVTSLPFIIIVELLPPKVKF